jgi:hypothetical protein
MGYTQAQLAGLLATTHEKFPDNELNITWDDNRWEWLRIFNQEATVTKSGTYIMDKVLLDEEGTARYVDFYEEDELSQGIEILETTTPWCRFTANWSWDELEILESKDDPEGFIDLAKAKETQAMWNLSKLIENRGFQCPTSATDNKFPRGFPYFIRWMDADTTTDGFVGQTIRFANGSSSTTCAGIDASTYTNWKNWAALYTNVDATLITKFRTAFEYSTFIPPMIANDMAARRSAPRRIYCSQANKVALLDFLDAKDDMHTTKDALGRMVVTQGNDCMINGVDVRSMKNLNSLTDPVTGDSPEPWYYVDFTYFQPVVRKGYWMKRMGPVHGGTKQHSVYTMFVDGAHNVRCTNAREAGFVIHKALTA